MPIGEQSLTLDRVRRIRQIRRFLRSTPEELEQHQVQALDRVVEEAFGTEPYRRLYGSRPRIERLEDLQALPVTDRTYLARFDVADRIAVAAPDLEPQPSTGTTGELMVSMRSPQENAFQDTLISRQFLARGVPPDFRHLILHFALDPEAPLRVAGAEGWVPGWGAIEKQVEAVRSFRPTAMSGPPSCLLELGEALGGWPVKTLMTFGEATSSKDREYLKSLFRSEIFDMYSASETGHVSWECDRHSGYHINSDAVIVEVLDDNNQPVPAGETGHLTITTLWNLSTPVIRYRIKDMGSLLSDGCSCGVTLPLMGAVEGRDSDRLVGHDGRRVSCMRFALALVGPYHQTMRRWRLVQRAVDDILVEVIWDGEPVPDLASKMEEVWSRTLAGPVKVELRSVDRFSSPRGRKFRWVETLVRQGGGNGSVT